MLQEVVPPSLVGLIGVVEIFSTTMLDHSERVGKVEKNMPKSLWVIISLSEGENALGIDDWRFSSHRAINSTQGFIMLFQHAGTL